MFKFITPNKIMRLFEKKHTKWKPLGSFSFGSKEYVTFIRKNNETGMLQFRTKRVNGFMFDLGCVNPFFPINIIDTKKAWDETINL